MKTLATALAILGVAAGSAAAQERIDRTLPSAPRGSVQIINPAGDVRVVGWDRDEIRITGTLGRGVERLAVEGDRERTEIRVVVPGRDRSEQGSDLVVRVPAGKAVGVRTASADIEVEGITGQVDATSASGDVAVRGAPASVSASSTSGDVRLAVSAARVRAHTTSGDLRLGGEVRESVNVESVSGDVWVEAGAPEVRAKSVSGNVMLSRAVGRVSAATVSGDVQIQEGRVQYGSFESVSGNLHYRGDLLPGAAFNAQSHSGDIVLELPRGVNARFEARTFSGDIGNQFGPEAERTSRHAPGRELRFSTGSGDGMVTLKTFSGSVKLLRR